MLSGSSVYGESLAKKSQEKNMPQYKFIIQKTVFKLYSLKSFWHGCVNRIQILMEKSSNKTKNSAFREYIGSVKSLFLPSSCGFSWPSGAN